jgi:hypothetical protein
LAESRARANAVKGATVSRSSHRRKAPSCADCFFHKRQLCALGLDEPCPTFRPDTPRGLVPPVQPALLPREPGALGQAA